MDDSSVVRMDDTVSSGVGRHEPLRTGEETVSNGNLGEHDVFVEIGASNLKSLHVNADVAKSSKDLKNEEKQADAAVPYWKLYVFADKLDVLLIVIGAIGSIANGLAQPLMTILFGQIINSFGSNQADTEKMIHAVSKVALRFVYLGIGCGVASYLQVACWISAGERQSARIRSLYLKQIMRQDVVFFDKDTTTGEVVARMSGDTLLVADAMGEKVGKFIQGISTFFGGYTIAFSRNWKLTLVMLSAVPLLIGAGGIMSMKLVTMSARAQESYAAAGSLVEQVISAIRTVSSFTGEKKAVEEYDKALSSAEKQGSRQGLVLGSGLGFFLGVMFATYSLALWYGSKLVLNEGAKGGVILNVIFAVLTGGMAMSQTSPSLSAFALGRAAAYKMFQVIDRVPEIDVYDKSGIIPNKVKADIEFRNVGFHYPTRPDYQIFSKFSLSIPSGKTVALVGESGSGKSTVISLIERFYDPQDGAVLFDGVNIKDLQLKWLRQQIGLVSQEPVLFSASIKDNIGYGKEGATFAEIQSAAALANAAKFISRIPQEYETLVGERGVQLSGGQKQRIAIARAILKNPQILLLDEATSALDAGSERVVQDALDKIIVDRTTVVVAHRLTTVRNANLIAVLQRGVIVEIGSHNELVRSPEGAYSQLIRLQEISGAQGGCEAVDNVDPDDIPENLSINDSLIKSQSVRAVFGPSLNKGGSSRRSSSLRVSSSTGKSVVDLQGALDTQISHSRTVGDIESSGKEGPQLDVSIFRLATLSKPEIPWFIVGSVAAACSGIKFPVMALLLSSAISAFYESPGKQRKDIDFYALMFLVLAIGVSLVSVVQLGSFAIIGNRLVRRVRRLTYENMLRQEVGWFDEGVNSSGALGSRLAGDATSIKSLVADSVALLVQNIAALASGMVIAFTGSWQLCLVVLAVLPVLTLQGFYNMKSMKGFNTKAKEQYEEATKVANDAVSSIRTVASFCAEEKVCALYEAKCVSPVKIGIRQGLVSGTGLAFTNFGMYACNGLSFWVGGKLVDSGETTFKDVFRTFFAVTLSTIGIVQAADLIPELTKVKSAVQSIFSVVDRHSKIDPTDTNGLTLKTVKGDIVFQHVEFRYPTRIDFPIFKDFCLNIEAGKTVAIVGESGSGKSTVISLIERFYDPISGTVLLDKMDIRRLRLKWYRQQIGLVSQEPNLFNESIRWNITYGKDGLVSDNEIQTVAESANAHKFITSFPDGYDTRVGERGIQLSGGQKQRIAIARAILKNPRVLLLDEATSALDAESEHVVQEALDRVIVNRTTVVVAHRLSTIRNADVIAVVQGGVIVEQGTHHDLLERGNGAYAALIHLHMNSDS